MTTRFAPSPTGHLHLGHAFSAMVAFQRAMSSHGTFLLRFEDIDHTRTREDYYALIEEDLKWLGIQWNQAPWRQLDRLKHYTDALEQLKNLGVVYPCFCTRREIETELATFSQAPQGPEGPLYPGTCRDQKKNLLDPREPAWRLNAQKAHQLAGRLTFHDRVHGKVEVKGALLGDLILARKDIGTSYHLAVVVDDAAQEIELITRGEDLLHATHIHRVLQKLLDFPEPEYEHHRLICDEAGKRLAKRNDSLSLRTLRENGVLPAELLARLQPF
ncbi:MAG: tRNA glutamyl-Q(34) synthetase GluQRS [Akkermansiaceae bacterium]